MVSYVDEKLQYDMNKEATKISALSSSKTGKYEYLKDKEILPSDQSKIAKQAKFTNSPWGKALEIQTKNDWRPRRKTNKSN